MKALRNITLGLGLLAAPILPAAAAPITGSIDISGLFRGEDAAGTNVRLNDAVGIDFCGNVSGTCVESAGAPGTGTGTFLLNQSSISGLPFMMGDTGTIKDIADFRTFSGPIANFLSVNGLTMDLETLTGTSFAVPGGIPGSPGTDYLFLNGTGTLKLAGYDDTPGTFTFSGQSDGISLLGTFSFSGGAAAIPVNVPVPAGLALFGAGLLGLTLVRRRNAA
ncbi:MAG: VPLPA-CTERM sorting domain-containing protein [Acetobacteraceae bacterium]|nr:VPLPA-CTERM sorting domain-containing protein [Acetobacteraceae bacterium]